MKTMIFTLSITLFSFAGLFAQGLEDILLDDFESGVVSFTEVVNVNPPAHMDVAVVDNPVKAGINTSNKVWEWKRYDAESDNKIWAGFYATLKNEVPNGYHRIEVKYLRTNATSQLKLKLEGAATKEIAAVTPASKTNEWETLIFDLTENEIKNIKIFGMFPDFYEPVNPTAVTYIDDIKIIYDESITPDPGPTTLTLFDNSASDRFHDQSWSTKTAPSTLVQEHWQGANLPDGDKLPVVTSPIKSGPNALKLQWKSAEGGSWMALVASIGWKLFDLTKMDTLKFWINSPVALSKAALPKFFFESGSGDPNKSGKLMLADYIEADLVANTWTEVKILLSDVWAANPAFTAKDLVKGVFFEQNAADNVEHTLYLDEFYFTTEKVLPVIDELILFENSASDRFHDQSWSTKTAPSTLMQEHWQEAGLPNGDKLPAVTSPVKSAPNALKMQWKSAEGGSWMALVAALNWKSFDLTAMKTLKFWIYSPVDLAKTALPKFFLESHSGNPNKSGKLLLASYVDADLVANTWTEVNISLADVWAADVAYTAKDVVKGIFFEQNTADNVEHTLYMDDFKFVSTATGINRPVMKSEIQAYYSNGEIRISNYSGNVKVFDLVGRKVAEGPAYDGNFKVNLKKGIYIVNTTKGNTKIALQ